MTNQAAQTMPTLPRPYWKAGDVKDDYGNPYNETDLFTDDDMRAMYQQGYAAALAQTAGVADGWKLVPVEPTEVMCEAAMSSLGWTRSEAAAKTAPITPASPMMEGSMKVWSAMLAAAPAASGGEGGIRDAYEGAREDLLDWKGRALRAEATLRGLGYTGICADEAPQHPSAASVSERARTASLKEIVPAEKRNYLDDNGNPRSIEDEAYAHGWNACRAATIRTLEQALTQQRGAPVFDRAWVVRDAELRAAAYNLLNLVEGVGCERWQNANGFRLKDTQQWVEFYIATKNVQSFGEVTTPQPSADAVRELVRRAYEVVHHDDECPAIGGCGDKDCRCDAVPFLRELESLLSGGSNA